MKTALKIYKTFDDLCDDYYSYFKSETDYSHGLVTWEARQPEIYQLEEKSKKLDCFGSVYEAQTYELKEEIMQALEVLLAREGINYTWNMTSTQLAKEMTDDVIGIMNRRLNLEL